MAWNLSKAKRRALVALQLRDKKGRFIDMGKSVKWYSAKHKAEVGGVVEDGEGTRAIVRMTTGPDKGKLVHVEASQIEVIESKASLNPADAPEVPGTSKESISPSEPQAAVPASESGFAHEGKKLSEVSLQDMAKMEKGTTLSSPYNSGHFTKGDGDVWQQTLSNGSKGSMGSSASIANHDGFAEWTFSKDAPAAKLPNPKDDPEYDATMAKYGDPEGTFKPIITKTSDGNTYISAPEGGQLYTPAKELAVGDEIIAPDGTDPQKPFSMGKAWPTKNAERVAKDGPQIGKVLSIKEHAYAVVQLPDGHTADSVKNPGEKVNTVTVGLSNKVIKATPELKAALKDVIPEPVYSDNNAPAAPDANAEKMAKRLDLLKSVPPKSTVTAKDGSVEYTKQEDGTWSANDGTGTHTSENLADYTTNKANPSGYTMFAPTAEDVGEVLPEDTGSVIDAAGPDFAAQLAKAPTVGYALEGKDDAFGAFDGFNPVELDALKAYVSTSMSANTALRKGGKPDEKSAKVIAGLDSVIDRSVLQEDTKVYRGVSADAALVDMLKNKGVMRDRAFTSTSVDKAFAEDWVSNTLSDQLAPVVMEINLPKGFKAHKLDYDAVGAGFSHENEVVLPRGLEFDITGVEEYTNAKGQKGYRVQASPLLNEKNYSQGDINGSNGNDSGASGDNSGDTGASGDSGTQPEQGGQVHVDSGTGGDSESGTGGSSSPEEPAASAPAGDDNGSVNDQTQQALDIANEALAALQKKLADDEAAKNDSNEPFEPVLPSAQKKPALAEPDKTEQTFPTEPNPEWAKSGKWDSDGSWLKSVEDRYAANPNKAKATVQESNNWALVENALRGDKSAVQSLYAAKYLDQPMLEKAIVSIDGHDAAFKAAHPAPSGAKPGAQVLKGYDLQPNQRGVFIPTEKLSPGAQMGLFNGDIYPPNLPFMLKDTNSGDTYYWDKSGTRRWGQYGAAGALTRRKNANGEYEYLLAQRGANMSSGANKWAVPGGAHKYESDAKANGLTAKTELSEELGYDAPGGPVANYKHQTSDDWAYDYSIFDSPADFEPDWGRVDTEEIQDMKWLTADQIKQMRDNGELQKDMGEVIDEVLNASESVDKDADQPETPETDSNAPETPSQAAEDTSSASEEDPDAALKAHAEKYMSFPEGISEEDKKAAIDQAVSTLKMTGMTNESVKEQNDKEAQDSQDSQDSQDTEASAEATPAEDTSADSSEPTVQVDGPSVTMADGNPAYVGSRVTHAKKGAGTVVKIIAGKSAKIEYDDGTSSIAQAHTINKFDGKVVANAPVDTSNMQPGEWGNNPANGKLFIVGSDGKALYQGDKVEAPHKGETKTGVIKGIYKTNNSIAIVFDGENKPSTKKAAVAKSLEATPDATPENAPNAPEASKYNESGFTADEQKQVDALEAELAKGWNAETSAKLDDLYEKGDARLAGKDVPEDSQPETVDSEESTSVDSSSTEDAAQPEESPVTEETPKEAPVTPAEASEETPVSPDSALNPEPAAPVREDDAGLSPEEADAAKTNYENQVLALMDQGSKGDKLTSEKLGKSYTKMGDSYWWSDDSTGENYADDEIITQNDTDDWAYEHAPSAPEPQKSNAVDLNDTSDLESIGEDVPEPNSDGDGTIPDPQADEFVPAKLPKKASEALPGTTLSVSSSDNNVFVKQDDGQWELEIDGFQTGIMANDDQVDGVYFNGNEFFNIDNAKPTPATPPAPANEPNGELADWEKELLNGGSDSESEADKKAAAAEAEAKSEAKPSDNGGAEELADWEKELLGDPVVTESKKSKYDAIQEIDTVEATYKALEALFPGTQIVGDNDPDMTWTKQPDGMWVNNYGYTNKAMDLQFFANEFKIIKDGPTPEYDSGAKKNNFDDYDGNVMVAPSGAELDDLKKGAKIVSDDPTDNTVWKKIADGNTGHGDGQWMNEHENHLYSGELADGSDFKVIEDGKSDADIQQEYEAKKAEMIDKHLIAVSKLPVGTILGNPEEDHWVKEGPDQWQNWFGQEPMNSFHTDSDISELQEIEKFHTENAILPKKDSTPEEAPKSLLSQYTVDEFHKLPVGSKVDCYSPYNQNEFLGSYTKTDSGWSYTSADGKQKDLHNPADTFDDFVGDTTTDNEGFKVVPAGPPSDAPTAKSLNQYSDEEWAAMPLGTKVKSYSGPSKTVLNGVYTKNDKGWEFESIDGNKIQNLPGLFDAFVGDFLFDSSEFEVALPDGSGDSKPELPEVETHVKKGLQADPDKFDKLPVGTTVKPEKNSSMFYPNDVYYVKQSDGSWQKFKKTPQKLMRGESLNSVMLAVNNNKVTVSVPKSPDHAVLGTGELAYVGDKVVGKSEGYTGNTYTIQKINKGGLKVLDENGNSVIIKPKDLGSDPDFGKKTPTGVTSDPATQASSQSTADAHAKMVAEQKIEEAKKKTETFAGASADAYDAEGVEMPAAEKAPDKHGIKVILQGEPDTSSPLYGAPKPVAPGNPTHYPSFQPPAGQELPKWDSAEWLKAVEERYKANPHKAKPTVQQSNNWGLVQSAMNGDKNSVKQLLDSMYLDQKMYDDAIAGIDAQTEKNKSIVEANQKLVDEAKAAYDKKKAADTADYTNLLDKYKKDLADWMAANPFADAVKPVKKPPVSTENFTGGKADWTKAHKGTYTAESVFKAMKDDNTLGSHGLSIATDSDQIEDLDVKVTKVLSASGAPVFEMKFKMTGPHGDALEAKFKADSSVLKDNHGIYPSNMVVDKSTGLLKESGKPYSSFINSGTRYSYSDPETGAEVVFQRASYTDGHNVSSNNNTVKIHMPLDTTPEQYQKALENLGIAKARPSTEGDIKVLAENKLISLMGTHQGSIKTYDGNKNMGGTARQKALDEIKQKYGVTPEDLTFSTEPNGRVKLFLSDEKASELAKKFGVSYFKHSVSGGNDPDRWVNMIAGKNPGMLSTYHRFTEGIGGQGKSSDTDMENGAGDYNYVTPMSDNGSTVSGTSKIVLKPSAVFKRTDFWANPGDGYGKKAGGGSTSNTSPYELFSSKGNIGYQGYGGGVYEVLPKDTVPLSDFAYIVVPSNIRQQIIDKLTEKGVIEVNGVPLEKFVLQSGMESPVDLSAPGLA
jgi:hypothetical protein